MKKLIVTAVISALLIVSCKKELRNDLEPVAEISQPRFVCGTMEAMKGVSAEMKERISTFSSRTETTVPFIVLYLDFDGAIISPGFGSHDRSPLVSMTKNCPPAPLIASQKQELIELVSDVFSPFNIIVTDDEAVFNSTSAGLRHLCVITTQPSVLGMPGGLGGVSPFMCNRIFNSPCFVFAHGLSSAIKLLASIVSHEVGHTFGLDHQASFGENCEFLSEYHPVIGSGDLAFGPIMGIGTNAGISNWFTQTCYKSQCRPNGQDDFLELSNSVELKPDDFPDTASGNEIPTGPVNGILERQADVDYILINFQAPGSVTIASENIDIKASLVTPGGHLLSEHNNPSATDLIIPIAKGMAFLKIEGASNSNMSSQFMTGKYKVTY